MIKATSSSHKFAVLTCGGVCPGMNDVIRSITMRSHQYNVRDVYGFRYGFRGLQGGPQHEPIRLTPYNTQHIHTSGGTILGTSRDPVIPARAIPSLLYHDISVLFVIGGNGGNTAAGILFDAIQEENHPIQVIGLPKSIDNDIDMIDQCFGFDTAVAEVSKVLRVARNEADAVQRGICIVQTMGRHSGFIAYNARGADIKLIPEQVISDEEIAEIVQQRVDTNQSVVICIAEGYPVPAQKLTDMLRCRIRDSYIKFIDPSYIIRGGVTTAFDHAFCTKLGEAAVDAAMNGHSGITVATKEGDIHYFDTKEITKHVKLCQGPWRASPVSKI